MRCCWPRWLAWSDRCPIAAADVTVEKTPQGVTVKIDGKPFTEYLIKSGSKPILWPIIGPTGKRVTRNWPMENDVPGETDRDHIHQRSLWFTHGNVNGIDFWSEGKGRIEHREFVKVEGGPAGRDRHAQRLAQPRRQQAGLPGRADAHASAATPTAAGSISTSRSRPRNGPVVFGDTKEGSFGVRVASSMRVDSKQGRPHRQQRRQDRTTPPGANRPPGSITTDRSTARPLGIAILNHPTQLPLSHATGTCAPTACSPPIRSA